MPIFLHENRQHDAIQAKLNFIIERREGGALKTNTENETFILGPSCDYQSWQGNKERR